MAVCSVCGSPVPPAKRRWDRPRTCAACKRAKKAAKQRRYRARNADACRERTQRWRHANIAKYLLYLAKQRAKERGLEFALTEADIVVPEVCPVLGFPIEPPSKPRTGRGASLDRIDPTKGYVPGNVVVISDRANRIKNDATLEELRALVRWMETIA